MGPVSQGGGGMGGYGGTGGVGGSNLSCFYFGVGVVGLWGVAGVCM
jgi:hypothetical protein